MSQESVFPHFKPLGIGDRETVHAFLWQYQPEISELTFSNLYMWRKKYHYRWALFENWLLLIATDENGKSYALEPIGPPPRNKAVLQLLDYLSRQPSGKPEIDRADKRIVGELQADQKFIAEPLREHFDYLYYTTNLVNLSGRRFHSKRNRNRFFKLPLRLSTSRLPHIPMYGILRPMVQNLPLQGDPSSEEFVAVNEVLAQFSRLHLSGAAIYIDGTMQGFTIGELLNDNTCHSR